MSDTDYILWLLTWDSEVQRFLAWDERVELHLALGALFGGKTPEISAKLGEKMTETALKMQAEGWQRPKVLYVLDEFGKIEKTKSNEK